MERSDGVVITGAGSGIGEATAREVAAAGGTPLLWDLDEKGLDRVRRSIESRGGDTITRTVDVSLVDQVDAAFAAIPDHLTARYLVNNAGPPHSHPGTFMGNVALALGIYDTVTTAWLRSGRASDGAVVNVASVAGAYSGAGTDWYCTVKAGVAGLTRQLAVQRPQQIRANAVAPSLVATPRASAIIDTDFGRELAARNPMGRVCEPHEVASVIVFLLSDAASYVNGVVLPVDGGALVNL